MCMRSGLWLFEQYCKCISNGNCSKQQWEIIAEGYTEEGVSYTVFQNKTLDTGSTPYLMDHQKISCTVNFDGNIVPPSTWYLVTQINSTTYKGTLKLTSYYFDNFLGSKKTIALYSGTVYGTL